MTKNQLSKKLYSIYTDEYISYKYGFIIDIYDIIDVIVDEVKEDILDKLSNKELMGLIESGRKSLAKLKSYDIIKGAVFDNLEALGFEEL